jgi:hypothetical protein
MILISKCLVPRAHSWPAGSRCDTLGPAMGDGWRRLQGRHWRLLVEAVLAIGLLIAVQSRLSGAVEHVPFDGDEGRYIALGRYFGYLFLERDLGRPEWGDNYWTHTQPMLPRLVLGGWLWARGYELEALPQPYLWQKSFKENVRQGRVPDDVLLAEARAPMVWLTSGSIVLLYLLGRVLAGPIAGLAATGLAWVGPLVREDLLRARSDSPLGFFLLLALLVGIIGARRGRVGALSTRWAIGLGVVLGLGLATKLTATFGLVAVVAWGVVMAATHRDSRHPLARARGWALAAVIAGAVFILTNPHLYENPVLHAGHMLEQRTAEMEEQQRDDPHKAIYGFANRVRYVLGGSFADYGPNRKSKIPYGAALASVGFAALLGRTWWRWRRTKVVPVEGLVVLTALAYFAGISLGLNMSWQRYLVPTVLVGALLGGVGLGAVASRLVSAGRVLRPRLAGIEQRLAAVAHGRSLRVAGSGGGRSVAGPGDAPLASS